MTDKPDVRLEVSVTSSLGEPQYVHLRARVYILARDPYGDEKMGLQDPDSYSFDWDSKTRALAGLEITAQADAGTMRNPGQEWYAWTVSYSRHTVRLRDAEGMLPWLRKVDKAMERLAAANGHPVDLAQFCTHAARAVTTYHHPFLRRVPDAQDYESAGYRSMDTDALRYHLQSECSQWRESHGITVRE